MIWSNSAALTYPSDSAASRKVDPSWLARCAISAARSYPMTGDSAVTSISDRSTSEAMRSRFSDAPSTQKTRNVLHAPASSVAECRKLAMITGRMVFSSRFPDEAANPTTASLPSTCAHTISMASHWVGFTFPGMIEDPGSFSGSTSSPSPARGPDPSQRMSLAIFASGTASPRSPEDAAASASEPPSAANLFGAVTNGYPVASAISDATSNTEPGRRVQPGADRGPAHRELVQARARAHENVKRSRQLSGVPGPLLPHRERDRVLQVSPPDLHHVPPQPGLERQWRPAARSPPG